jgi:hypothetical protein
MDARNALLKEIFYSSNSNFLCQILMDSANGLTLIRKIIISCCISSDEQSQLSLQVSKAAMENEEIKNSSTVKRFLDELTPFLADYKESQKEDESVSPLTPRAQINFQSVTTPMKANYDQPFLPTPGLTPNGK